MRSMPTVKRKYINQLDDADSRRLRAAEGWFELGDLDSAGKELENISSDGKTHPAVLVMYYEIYAKAKKWDMAAVLAESLVKVLPDDPEAWLNFAFTERLKRGGSVEDAKAILIEAEPKFPGEYLFPYNLACYCAQLHEFDEAKEWFKKAMLLDEKTVQKSALDEPDLKPFWDSMSGTLWKKE